MVAPENNTCCYPTDSEIPHAIFRTYDIRGPVKSDGVNPNLAYAIGLVFGSMAQEQGQSAVIVGRDGRLTGELIQGALIQGLLASGVNVVDIGMVSTPMLYFATHTLDTQSGIMVTASHNPAPDNGFKMVLAPKTLATADIQQILHRIKTKQYLSGQGQLIHYDILEEYVEAITSRIQIDRPLKVVLDCGNGAGGIAAPILLKRLGCEVVELYTQVDGNFPNHHPDPTIPANLTDLITTVKAEQADIGLALDGDADRLGIVTNEGEIIWPDRQLMLYAADCLQRNPGEQILFDVKCTNRLPQYIAQHGGQPIMGKTGHSLMKAKMKELNVPMAGEMSGHIFFNDEWYGFDDGLYVAARLLRILAAQSLPASALFATLPNSINTPELKLPMADVDKPEFMQRLSVESNFNEQERITIDGLRLEFEHGWGLIRPSNTSPYLIIRFEADNADYLEEIKALFRRELLALDAQLQLPF